MKKFIFLFVFLIYNLLFSEIIFDFELSTEGWKSEDKNTEIFYTTRYSSSGNYSLCAKVNNSKELRIFYDGILDFKYSDYLSFKIYIPEEGGIDCEFMCYIKDDEWNWFETGKFKIKRGEEKTIILNLMENTDFWQPVSHLKVFDAYVKENIKEFGIIIWFPYNYSGRVYFDRFETSKEIKKDKFYIYNFRENSKRIGKYEKFEITFEIPVIYENPFNPDLKIKGVFVAPSGKVLEVPAFFYHDYLRTIYEDGEKLIPYGKSEWKIRFTPEEVGIYKYKLEMSNEEKRVEINIGNFEVFESDKNGFVNWDKKDKNYLSFSNGKFFYPIGYTLRSPDDEREPYKYEFKYKKGLGTYAYDKYLKKMAENKGNYIRMWMSPWWVGIEWNSNYGVHYKNLGKYSLENAWKLDYVLDIAEKYGIYIDLTLINHGQFSIHPDAEWWDNPYNEINGGFLKSPDEFFVNERAIEYFKKRLEYIVSRWSYSSSIAFWELWNEVDLTGYYDSGKVRYWHKKIYPFLKEIDPYKRSITTHYCRRPDDPMVWIIPELESLVGNAYDNRVIYSIRDYYEKRKFYGKPMMINEFGVGKNRNYLEDNLHGGIWASSMTPMFGVALFWWWPFIDYFDLYYHYKSLAKFWENEDRRGKFLQLSDGKIKGKNVDFIGIQNDEEGYFWIFDEKIFNSSLKRINSVRIENVMLELKNFKNGLYQVEFWDTYKGEIVEKISIENVKNLVIPVIPFEKDIALKVKKIK
ncbi:MAG: DUF5060 domain-containing protein [Candidatus Omnitrophica bacterium]|nr:DUF5060 domain-containing protein [Candidatus Omnitrophota bacterium]